MPDYGCHAVWEITQSGSENTDPDDLPISIQLAEALTVWAARYDATLDQSDPLASGFSTAN